MRKYISFNLVMSIPSIKLCTWNVRGIHHPVKRKKILTSFKKEGVEIALLQETHLEDQEHLKLKRDWVGDTFFFVLDLK